MNPKRITGVEDEKVMEEEKTMQIDGRKSDGRQDKLQTPDNISIIRRRVSYPGIFSNTPSNSLAENVSEAIGTPWKWEGPSRSGKDLLKAARIP